MKIVSNPCRLAERLHCLGPYSMPVFLLDGDRPVLFEGGMYEFGPHYLAEIYKILGDRNPAYILLTHMHFDHCGATGYLKRHFPSALIGQSAEGAEIIKKQSAVDLITKLNAQGREGTFFEPFAVDMILSDGDILQVSEDETIHVIKTPGHTWDHLSYYLPHLKALIPSEAAGVPGRGDYIVSDFLIGYDSYIGSLQRLSTLDVDILILAHGSCYTGQDARNFFPRAIECAIHFQKRITSLLGEYGKDHEAVVDTVRREEHNLIRVDKQSEIPYLINLRAKIKAVARDMEKSTLNTR